MKVLVVSLALTIFAVSKMKICLIRPQPQARDKGSPVINKSNRDPGSQAFVLRDESPSKLSQLEKELANDMRNLHIAMNKKAEIAENSEIGKVLCTWKEEGIKALACAIMRSCTSTRLRHHLSEINRKCIELSTANASYVDAGCSVTALDCALIQLGQRMEALVNAFPPEVEETGNQIAITLRNGAFIIFMGMKELGRRLSVESRALHQALEHDLDPILEKLEPYTQLLHQGLVKVGTGLNEKLDEMLKWSVERLQPLAKEMPSKFQEVQGSLDPIVGQAQKVIVTEVENSRDTLQQVASRILGVLRKYGEFLNQ